MEHTLRLRKGAWTSEEDDRLRTCIGMYGEGQWHRVPLRAGLNRCRKSCRLRWLNYLKPNIKRGDFALDEVDLIMRLHKLIGNRWSLIAGRLPGRTANDVKNYWNTHLKKKQILSSNEITTPKITRNNIIKPRPRTFSNKFFFWSDHQSTTGIHQIADKTKISPMFPLPPESHHHNNESSSFWWEHLLDDSHGDELMKQFNNNGGLEENVGQQTETNAQDKSVWTDLCLDDDVSFWDLLDAARDDHVSI